MRVFLLPMNGYILRPTYVWHVGMNQVLVKMPKAETDLFDFHKKNSSAGFESVERAFHQVARSIQWLHDRGLAHRDIKPENVVLHKNRFKLIDFDFCSPLEEFVQCGTPNFMCPERLVKAWDCSPQDASRRSDVYSFGKLILSSLWHFYTQAPIRQRKRMWDMFHADYINHSFINTDPAKLAWINVAVQCCGKTPPCKIPILPTTIKNTFAAVDAVADPTTLQVVDADVVFA